jgi:hypothetical protein
MRLGRRSRARARRRQVVCVFQDDFRGPVVLPAQVDAAVQCSRESDGSDVQRSRLRQQRYALSLLRRTTADGSVFVPEIVFALCGGRLKILCGPSADL